MEHGAFSVITNVVVNDNRLIVKRIMADESETIWRLHGCCEREESILLGLYFLYGILIHCFYAHEVFYPFKLLAVFLHEMGHGSAAFVDLR
jgi:Peptidase M50B-like